jgi:hypothetical protein
MTVRNTETNHDDTQYAEFGRAAIIPGIQAAIDHLQGLLEDLRLQLAAAQGRRVTHEPAAAQRAAAVKRAYTKRAPTEEKTEEKEIPTVRKALNRKMRNAQAGYWAQFTPEERKAEMMRRLKVRNRNAAAARKAA